MYRKAYNCCVIAFYFIYMNTKLILYSVCTSSIQCFSCI